MILPATMQLMLQIRNSSLDAVTAVYLISEKFPSPMGADLSAFSKRTGAEEFQKQFGGELKSWSDLLVKFKVK